MHIPTFVFIFILFLKNILLLLLYLKHVIKMLGYNLGCYNPSLICMLLDSLEYLADFAVPQAEDPFDHCVHLLHNLAQLVYRFFAVYLNYLYPSDA